MDSENENKRLKAHVAALLKAAKQVLSDIDDDGVAERGDMGVLALRSAVLQAQGPTTKLVANVEDQRKAYEAHVRSGESPVPASEVEKPLADGSYRTSAANAGWAFWRAAQADLQRS